MRDKFNLFFFLCSLVVLLLTSAGLYGLHYVQVRRTGPALLEQARAADAKGNLERAVRFLRMYLNFRPRDTEARILYGDVLDRMSSTPKARGAVIDVFERVLIDEPDRVAVRRRLAAMLVGLRQFGTAQDHLEILVRSCPDDVELEYLLGVCHEDRAKYASAADLYRAAVQHAPKRLEPFAPLGVPPAAPPRAPITVRCVSPQECAVDSIGHFGLFREGLKNTLWKEIRDWINSKRR